MKKWPRPPAAWLQQRWPAAALPNYLRCRLTVAHHEAAHSVLMSLGRVRFTSAQVYDDLSGSVTPHKVKAPPDSITFPPEIMQMAAIRLATEYVSGIVAELMYHDISEDGWLLIGLPDHWPEFQDYINARFVLRETYGNDFPLYFCQRLARSILGENWGWVSGVAAAIDKNGTISEAEVRRLRPIPTVHACPRPPEDWIQQRLPMIDLPVFRRDRRSLAFHESGHAILCCLHGIPFDYVCLNGDGSGFVEIRRDGTPPDEIIAQLEFMQRAALGLSAMYVGGVAAELLLHELDVAGPLALGLSDCCPYWTDYRNARAALDTAFDPGTSLHYVERLARSELSEHWLWLRAVAAVIDDTGAITQDEVLRLRPAPSPSEATVTV